MDRRPRSSSTSRTRSGKVLARLNPEEGARVLRALLERPSELVAEPEEIARVTLPGGAAFSPRWHDGSEPVGSAFVAARDSGYLRERA